MMASSSRRKRPRGRIEKLTSGSLRVSVYAGIDPLTKRRIYVRETIPAGSRAQAEAERALTRLLNQVDEKRQPRTSATVEQLLDRYLGLLDVGASTRRGYEGYIRKHIRPALGSLKVSRVNAETLESFYAELRRCRDHCDRRRNGIAHRTTRRHECDPHPGMTCSPMDPACRNCRRMCKPHVCKPRPRRGAPMDQFFDAALSRLHQDDLRRNARWHRVARRFRRPFDPTPSN